VRRTGQKPWKRKEAHIGKLASEVHAPTRAANNSALAQLLRQYKTLYDIGEENVQEIAFQPAGSIDAR